jgi:hypothetical protein
MADFLLVREHGEEEWWTTGVPVTEDIVALRDMAKQHVLDAIEPNVSSMSDTTYVDISPDNGKHFRTFEIEWRYEFLSDVFEVDPNTLELDYE